jgi:hypothetical protein
MLLYSACKATGFLYKFVQIEKFMHRCDLKDKDEKRAWYQAQINQMSPELLALRLSQPALRALVDLQVFNVLDLQQVDALTLKNSHGIGPNALKKLESLR